MQKLRRLVFFCRLKMIYISPIIKMFCLCITNKLCYSRCTLVLFKGRQSVLFHRAKQRTCQRWILKCLTFTKPAQHTFKFPPSYCRWPTCCMTLRWSGCHLGASLSEIYAGSSIGIVSVLKVAQNHVLRGAADECGAQSLSSPLTAGHGVVMYDANQRRHPAKGLSVLCSSLSA